MKLNFIFVLINICLWIFLVAVAGYVVYLVIKALKKYTRSVPVRKEKAEHAKTLGEILKQHRLNCKMTQEFVAETLGVSRQAVSSGKAEFPIVKDTTPNITNSRLNNIP
ncbi:MAG: XRE family transcriptional regulator [Lachnospiraceae bacterium]